jgi:succinate dehydrogenase/fumarate reductase flavoprotein subunit
MKRKWLMATLVTGVLAASITGGVAFAQNGNSEAYPKAELAARVAQILELDEQRVQDAITQATQELRDERVDRMLESGRITEERAEELRERLQSGQGLLGRGHHRQFFGERGFGRGFDHGLDGLRDGLHQRSPAIGAPAPEVTSF